MNYLVNTNSLFTCLGTLDGTMTRIEENTGTETVARYFDFFTRHMKENCAYNFYVKDDADVVAELESAVLGLM